MIIYKNMIITASGDTKTDKYQWNDKTYQNYSYCTVGWLKHFTRLIMSQSKRSIPLP